MFYQKLGFVLSLLAKYIIPSLLSSRDTIKRIVCGMNFVSKTVIAVYIIVNTYVCDRCLAFAFSSFFSFNNFMFLNVCRYLYLPLRA